MNADRYCEAWLPDRWKVFGRRLQPLCLGHVMLLQRLGNAAVRLDSSTDSTGPDPMPDALELLLAVWLCGGTYRHARHEIERGLSHKFRLWAMIVRFITLTRPAELIRGWLLWRSYLAAALAAPKVWIQGQSGREPGTPWFVVLYLQLLKLGYRPDEALELPLGQGIWESFAERELSGGIELCNDIEESILTAKVNPCSITS